MFLSLLSWTTKIGTESFSLDNYKQNATNILKWKYIFVIYNDLV